MKAASDVRAARARRLAGMHPASREALLFYAEIAEWEAGAADLAGLRAVVGRKGPRRLAEAIAELDEAAIEESIERYLRLGEDGTPSGFVARALLGVRGGFATRQTPVAGLCPRCGHRPQVGRLEPEGHGAALSLVCSLCGKTWAYPRGRCAGCGEADERRLAYYRAETLAHIEAMTCESCRRYLHLVDVGRDPEAIPEVDELAAMPLDAWVRERGYRKLQPNLVGI